MTTANETCQKCGRTLKPAWKICGYCGTPRAAAMEPVAEPPRTAAAEPVAAPPRTAVAEPVAAPPPAAATSAAPNATTFGQWLRSLPTDRFPRTASVDRAHVEELARFLRTVRDRRVIADDEFRLLHQALQVRGVPKPADTHFYERAVWTVGLGSLSWNRLERGAWVPQPAPIHVELDKRVLESIAPASRPASPRLLHLEGK